MPLQKQPVAIPLADLNQGDEPKLHQGLLKLENGIFKRAGTISKRYGRTEVMSDTTIDCLMRWKDRPVGIEKDGNDEGVIVHTGATNVTSGSAEAKTVNGQPTHVGMCDAFTTAMLTPGGRGDGSSCSVASGTTGSIMVQAYAQYSDSVANSAQLGIVSVDEDSGHVLDYVLVDEGAARHHVECVGIGTSFLWVFYNKANGNLAGRGVNSAGAISAEVNLTSLSAIDQGGSLVPFSAAAVGTTDVAFCYPSATGTIVQAMVTVASASSISSQTENTLTSPTTLDAWAVVKWATDEALYLWADDTGSVLNIKGEVRNTSLVLQHNNSDVTLDAYGSGTHTAYRITGVSTGTDAATVFYQLIHNTAVDYNHIYYNTLSFSGGDLVAGTDSEVAGLRKCQIWSRPMIDSDSIMHLGVYMDQDAETQGDYPQGTFAIVRWDTTDTDDGPAMLEARLLPARAVPMGEDDGVLSAVAGVDEYETDKWRIGCLELIPNADGGGTTGYANNAAYATFDRTRTDCPQWVEDGEGLYISNGAPVMFDGYKCTEFGFFHRPHFESITVNGSGSGFGPGDGTYGYVAVYEWTDAQGRLHLSAPSDAQSVTTDGSTSDIDMSITTLGLTRKEGVEVVIYRTDANGSTYKRVATAPNDPTSGEFGSFDYTDSGVTTTGRAVLYTTGGILDHSMAESHRVCTMWQHRYWYVPRDREDRVLRFSKVIIDGEAPAFNEVLEVPMTAEGGAVVGMAPLGDKLVIFKRNSIYALAGIGPDETGAGSSYGEPFIVSESIGCSNNKTIVVMPQGVMFLSDDGIHLINRGLQLQNVGRPVKFHTDTLSIISAVVWPEINGVIFFSTADPALCYNYLFNQWSTWTNCDVTGAVFANNTVYIADSGASEVHAFDTSVFADDSVDFDTTVETGWIHPGVIAGYQRWYEAVLKGYALQSVTLTIKAAYDYDAYWKDSQTFATGDIGTYPIWSDVFGAGSTANEDKTFAVKFQGSRQKCTAVRFSFSDSGHSTGGDNFEVYALGLLLGVKKDLWRLGAARDIG